MNASNEAETTKKIRWENEEKNIKDKVSGKMETKNMEYPRENGRKKTVKNKNKLEMKGNKRKCRRYQKEKQLKWKRKTSTRYKKDMNL